ncbi:glycosyltransferase [Kineococcus rhizosphaerae]|uniref:Glycosyltransferase involved in cell wall biosynthesis n=1 Tax=Kineococcus rhizosphaerae TaxID=559628 RepID=A0A2T0QYG1_9ACTN|nr:glycosyltransferase [Kineococcus rhizosphaerae]PRY11417.1 glycosyltransferase involved in cell wall biosynthesis [Kineococcus rhizosphaerae]
MPRVAVVRHTFGLPSEPFVLAQARALRRWEPVLVSRDPLPAGLDGAALDPRSAVLHTAGLSSRALADLLRSLRVDAVLAHFGVEAACALPATRRAGVPLATVFHGFDATTSSAALLRARKVSWATYVRRRAALARRGELFLPVSDHLRSRLLDRGFPAARTRTHHLGIDLDELPVVPVVPAARTVVHVGRLVAKKGHADLFHALSELPGVRLTCVGDGPLRADLERLAAHLRLDVEFTGALDHAAVLRRVASAAVLCLPSTTGPTGDEEGLGQVLLEAGALGRPVVATRHGGIPSAVVDGTTGLLVPERDPRALAAALRRVLDDDGLARSLGAAAAQHVRTRFDVHRQTARLEELLDGLVGVGGR